MQNRGMFPYRRQGPKKRKGGGGGGNPPRRGRGPMRPLPNSARELIPFLQPTTKALAQVLAGRSGDSGQLAYAQTVLAHAERLVADRQANRLNPAEREELFEQIARLKLTITDAEAEAEIEAESEEVRREPIPAVGRDRLREMALALGSPRPVEIPPPAAPTSEAEPALGAGHEDEEAAAERPADDEAAPAPKSEQNQRAGRLQLSASGGEAAATAVTLRGPVRRRGTSGRPPARLKPAPASDDEPAPTPAPAGTRDAAPSAGVEHSTEPLGPSATTNGHDSGGEATRTSSAETPPAGEERVRRTRKGIPDGWVVDDEGFVVPGPV